MEEHEIDALVFAALNTEPGRILLAWLQNNYLLTPKATADPNQALVAHSNACFVAMLQSRYSRHIETQQRGKQPNEPARSRKSKHFRRSEPGSEQS